MQEDDVEWESFLVVSIDLLLVYENKYYLQVNSDDCAYKIAKKTNNILCSWKSFWRLGIINVVLRKI